MATINKKVSFLIVIIFMLAGFFLVRNTNKISAPSNINSVMIGDTEVRVDLAQSKSEQEMGLSGRAGLEENKGMLFVFNTPGVYKFWMKDMNFAIDIIWIAGDQKIIYIKKSAPPDSYPETFGTEIPAKYILEVVSGFSDSHDLKVGDTVEFK